MDSKWFWKTMLKVDWKRQCNALRCICVGKEDLKPLEFFVVLQFLRDCITIAYRLQSPVACAKQESSRRTRSTQTRKRRITRPTENIYVVRLVLLFSVTVSVVCSFYCPALVQIIAWWTH